MVKASVKEKSIFDESVCNGILPCVTLSLRLRSAPFKRPAHLSTDTATSVDALIHATRFMEEFRGFKYDVVVELMCTNPFKTADHVNQAIEKLISTNSDSVIGVSKVEESHPARIKKIVDEFGGNLKKIYIVKDKIEDLEKLIKRLEDFDILITSGGISKGKYDFVKKVLCNQKMRVLFDQVSIKPGKPTTFGKFKNNKFILGLPGNPVSCFISMLNFFPIFIKCFLGKELTILNKGFYKSKKSIKKNGQLTTFQRVKCNGNSFEIFNNQDSSYQSILTESTGLIYRPPYSKEIRKNEIVEIITFNSVTEYNI